MLLKTILACLTAVAIALPVYADVPGGVEVGVRVDRKQFRSAAKGQIQGTFCLYDAQTGGNLCECKTVQLADLTAFRIKTEKFDSVPRRKFVQVEGVMGSDGDPVTLCPGTVSWVELQIGTTVFNQDRRRLESVAFAKEGEPSADVSVRVFNLAPISIPNGLATSLTFDSELWDTADIHNPNASCLIAPEDGKYFIFAHVSFSVNGAGYRVLRLLLNGGVILAQNMLPSSSPSVEAPFGVSTHFELAVGDCVEVQAIQTSGGPLDVLAVGWYTPHFGMVKLP